MGWLDWLSGAIGTVEHAIGSGVSYVEHLIFPSKNTHIKSGHAFGYKPHIPESSYVYRQFKEVPKHKVHIPNLGLTPTARKSLEEIRKGVIPPYIPKPEVSSSPTAEKPGVYTPYGYFRNSTDYTKYLIWKTPDVYFPDIFRSDRELHELYYIKHDYERARELFRKKYANLIKQAVSNPEIVKGIEWGSITHLKVVHGRLVPVNIESEVPPSMRKHWEETHQTIVRHIPPHSVPHPVTRHTKVTPPKFGLIYTNLVRTNTHISHPITHHVSHYSIKKETKEEKEHTEEEIISPAPTLSGIIETVIPVMSVVLMVFIVKKIISEVRV